MKNFIFSIIADLFFNIGYLIMNFGLWIHKAFSTVVGKELIRLEDFQKEFAKTVEETYKKDKLYFVNNEGKDQ